MSIGEIIKNKRNEKKWTQSQLAEKAGMTQPGLWAIENGRSSPKISSLQNIANALGCAVEDFLVEGNQQTG